MNRIPVKPKEIYHILWCISSHLEMDYMDTSKPDMGIKQSMSELFEILFYLNGCKCTSCRAGVKTLNKWLKEIHKPDSFYRIHDKKELK